MSTPGRSTPLEDKSTPSRSARFEDKSAALRQFEADVFAVGMRRENIHKVYNRWANSYDQLYVGFKSHHYIPRLLRPWLAPSTTPRILDAGAGTGLVGEQLLAAGYTQIDALDSSPTMLEEAQKRGVYQNTICDVLGPNRLPIQDNIYDGVVSLGVYLPNHAKEDSFDELVRIVKPGGIILLTIRQEVLRVYLDFRCGIEGAMKRYHDQGVWTWQVRKCMTSSDWQDEPGVVYVFQVL